MDMDIKNDNFSEEQQNEIVNMIEKAKQEIRVETDQRISKVEDYIAYEELVSSYVSLCMVIFFAGYKLYYE
jgi:F0F1-type ATP synthase membrane subunit b/b'